jgi:hypothetical protein
MIEMRWFVPVEGVKVLQYRQQYDATIEPMVSKANNNRVHALLLGCQLLGNSKDVEQILYFDCHGKIELHKEIDWAQEARKGK